MAPAQIPTIRLASGHEMPQLGLGTYRLQGAACTRAVKEALALGYTHIDTAEMYENEREIGAAIRDVPRERLFITSKAWMTHLRPDDMSAACARTLRDLGVDYLDLYLIHWPSKDVPVGEAVASLARLAQEGKARSIGVSNFSVRNLDAALAAARAAGVPLSVNQVEFHPWLFQRELLEHCARHGVALTAYSPLARGTLLEDRRLVRIASAHGKTPAQACLRWAMDKGVAVIPKAESLPHLEENMGALGFSLSPMEHAELDALPQQRLVHPPFAQF